MSTNGEEEGTATGNANPVEPTASGGVKPEAGAALEAPPAATAAMEGTAAAATDDIKLDGAGAKAAEALANIWKKDADDDQPRTFPQVVRTE